MKLKTLLILSTWVLCSACSLITLGQKATPTITDGTAQPSQTVPAPREDTSDASSYATGKPLAGQSKEGFWGHVNPFARKKWVNRQVDPIKDRTNELDQLQSKNANDIRDVDSRSQAGISRAMASANTADQHATDAKKRADLASGTATDAGSRTTSLNGTISNLDQYRTVSSAPLIFAAGRTTLGPKAKAQLDDVASRLATEKGYIIDVRGYSRDGVKMSQAMADSVVRYLVTAHQVPIYRIYRTGLGSNSEKAGHGVHPLTNSVVVSLMHNSLATMSASSALATPGQPSNLSSGVSHPEANQ